MSLSEKLLERFQTKPDQWIPGGSVERWTLENTDSTASNARRRLREMVEDGKLEQTEKIYKGTNHAWYRLANGAVEKKVRYEYVFDPEKNAMVEKRIEE